MTHNNVCIVVLGDIGRSPRMQYHALSLSEKGHKVDMLGYGDTQPLPQIKANAQVYYHYMIPVPQIPLKLVNYAFKTIFQALNLWFLLLTIRKPDVLMVQNPPAIPALLVCWIFCRIWGVKFIIDWHNYAHTIMALNLSKDHKLVKITQKVEEYIGRKADHNFCVTKQMQLDLQHKHIKATTLYDKPPEDFKPITLEEKHSFLVKLGQTYPEILRDKNTVFSKMVSNDVVPQENRPGILVSSTSWTEDEDFSVLFSALQDYENEHQNGNLGKLPDLICFITGKGHLKEYFCKKINEQKWRHVTVLTPWLEASDYPLILASADLGVCLHTSSSGLDLPMKVVDMFGCCLPVLAYDFPCLHELVKDGENSFTFNDSNELSKKLLWWFEEFPRKEEQIKTEGRFKNELQQFQKLRWRENWTNVAYEAFN